MSMFSDVRDFHIAFGQLVSDIPTLPEESVRNLRQKLLAEEFQEYFDAELEDDLIEIADALGDILYIINGTKVSYGLGNRNDLDSEFSIKGGRPALPRSIDMREARKSAIKTKYDLYVYAEKSNDLGNISEALQALTDAVFACSYVYGIPLFKVFNEIHFSNMAKLVNGKVLKRPDGKVAKPQGWQPPNIASILFPNGEDQEVS